MKLAVEFPSVAYREGGEAVRKMATAIEDIGFDQLEVFDHVVMGYPLTERRTRYPAQMPILEALMALSHFAAVTSKIGLGTEVLVLPQRQPVLVAKQFQTLDTLSNGRARLGLGVGWQPSEFEALSEPYANRGARTDEAIELIRSYWRDEQVDYVGEHYTAVAMAMEPKSIQAGGLPIWIGGVAPRALARVAKYGDGWLAPAIEDADVVQNALQTIQAGMASNGRDPASLGTQMMLTVPPRNNSDKDFYADLDRVVQRAAEVNSWGIECGSLNATAIFQAGARSIDEMLSVLAECYTRIKSEVG
ncbi:MAG: TIGR03619 family F420-dependent LLM class oxidoreductase [Pseudomonadales bacterium]|nr:TIGR03619 family F420-dependent LLM class oxidoreductase [Pseudomonadales bacterium]